MKNLVSLVLVNIIVLILTSCASTPKPTIVSAVSSDNLNWPFCVDVISTNMLGVVTLDGMLCAGATVDLTTLQAEYSALNPSAAYSAVKQVPPNEIKLVPPPVPKSGL